MAMTALERQARWRDRAKLKSKLFDVSEDARRQHIRDTFPDTRGDEGMEAVRTFFLNYPRCRVAPNAWQMREGDYLILFFEPVTIERTAADWALTEAGRRPVETPFRCGVISDICTVISETAEMRRLGLWDDAE